MKFYRPQPKHIFAFLVALVALFYLADFGRCGLDPSLDRSWIAVIAWASHHHLQFGRDIIFTYGPLGYLLYPINLPIVYWPALALKTVLHIVLLTMLFVLSAGLHPVRRAALILTAVIAAYYHPLTTQVFMIVMASWVIFFQQPRNRLLQAVAVMFLSLTFLMKGTDTLLVLPILIAGLGYLIWQRDTRSLAVTLVGLVIGTAAIWSLAGQRLSNLPAYGRSILELSRGYGEAMSYPPTPAILATGLIGLALLSLQIAATWFRNRSEVRAWFVSLVLSVVLFLVWKMSFTRADVHTTQLFFYGIPAALALPMFYGTRRPVMPRALEYLVIIGIFACGVYVIHTKTQLTFSGIVQNAAASLRSSAEGVVAPGRARTNVEAGYEADAQKLALPQIRQTVGRSTVDVFGWEQAVAIANDLNYTPRPVFQGYCADTAALIHANASFYRSARAPGYVIFKLQTLEAHVPAIDDAEALLVLTQDYEPVLAENGYILLRRKPAAPTPTELKPVGSGDLGWNEPIALPSGVIWCQLHVRKTFLGKLIGFFYQCPEIHVLGERSGSALPPNRIIPEPAANGFLLSPLLYSNGDFADLVSGNYEQVQTKSVRILRPKKANWYFQSRVFYRLFEVVRQN